MRFWTFMEALGGHLYEVFEVYWDPRDHRGRLYEVWEVYGHCRGS